MMDCKKALTESDGDFEKAIEILRKKVLLLQVNVQKNLLTKVWLLLNFLMTAKSFNYRTKLRNRFCC